MTDDDFVSQLDLARAIAAEIDTLTDEFDVDAVTYVAELRKQALDDARRDPRYQASAMRVGQARIALRRARIDLARKLQSDGIQENMSALEYWLWDGRLIDQCRSQLRPGEKLVQVSGFVLVTNHRSFTRAELKRACRMTVEIDDASFERNFNSDEAVHEVEARAAERERPNPYGRQLNYPGGIRPER